jgi:hypothetical protein
MMDSDVAEMELYLVRQWLPSAHYRHATRNFIHCEFEGAIAGARLGCIWWDGSTLG